MCYNEKKRPKSSEKNTFLVTKNETHIIIEFAKGVCFQILRKSLNRKLYSNILRLFTDGNGNPYLTLQNIADILEFNDRRDVDNYCQEFKRKDSDFTKLLVRKVDLSTSVPLIQEVVIENPMLPSNVLYDLFINKYPTYQMSHSCFIKYLANVNTSEVLKSIHKCYGIDNKWDNQILLSYLIENHQNPIIRKTICDLVSTNNLKNKTTSMCNLNLSIDNKSYLVKFLVGSNLSHETIALMLGISKSYVKKLLYRIPDFKETLINSITKYSGKIIVDEKYVKLNGEFGYVLSAVDKIKGIPLLSLYFPEKTKESWQVFFLHFKKYYGTPSLIISDGCPALIGGRALVFPNVKYQYCKFHKMRNLISKIFENTKDTKLIKKLIDKLKQVFSRETRKGRRAALLELETMMLGKLKKYFDEKFMKQWKHLAGSETSNAAERWNRKIEKIVSGKYGLKTPETIQQLVNCLWFKELIMRGHSHVSNESIVSKIKIGKLCQEYIDCSGLEKLFDITNDRKVA